MLRLVQGGLKGRLQEDHPEADEEVAQLQREGASRTKEMRQAQLLGRELADRRKGDRHSN